jgi:endonuclease/exonuclease/phosphatase family metal-dependent hydrolase
MRVVSYNIQYSLGRDGVYDLARTVDAVRDADVICLQEVDRHWPRTAMADQAADKVVAATLAESPTLAARQLRKCLCHASRSSRLRQTAARDSTRCHLGRSRFWAQ